jgi:hypothetical protein
MVGLAPPLYSSFFLPSSFLSVFKVTHAVCWRLGSIKSARGEHVGNRLTRILPNEVHLQIHKGEATADVIIPFTEIYEIQVRPKDA